MFSMDSACVGQLKSQPLKASEAEDLSLRLGQFWAMLELETALSRYPMAFPALETASLPHAAVLSMMDEGEIYTSRQYLAASTLSELR